MSSAKSDMVRTYMHISGTTVSTVCYRNCYMAEIFVIMNLNYNKDCELEKHQNVFDISSPNPKLILINYGKYCPE